MSTSGAGVSTATGWCGGGSGAGCGLLAAGCGGGGDTELHGPGLGVGVAGGDFPAQAVAGARVQIDGRADLPGHAVIGAGYVDGNLPALRVVQGEAAAGGGGCFVNVTVIAADGFFRTVPSAGEVDARSRWAEAGEATARQPARASTISSPRRIRRDQHDCRVTGRVVMLLPCRGAKNSGQRAGGVIRLATRSRPLRQVQLRVRSAWASGCRLVPGRVAMTHPGTGTA